MCVSAGSPTNDVYYARTIYRDNTNWRHIGVWNNKHKGIITGKRTGVIRVMKVPQTARFAQHVRGTPAAGETYSNRHWDDYEHAPGYGSLMEHPATS